MTQSHYIQFETIIFELFLESTSVKWRTHAVSSSEFQASGPASRKRRPLKFCPQSRQTYGQFQSSLILINTFVCVFRHATSVLSDMRNSPTTSHDHCAVEGTSSVALDFLIRAAATDCLLPPGEQRCESRRTDAASGAAVPNIRGLTCDPHSADSFRISIHECWGITHNGLLTANAVGSPSSIIPKITSPNTEHTRVYAHFCSATSRRRLQNNEDSRSFELFEIQHFTYNKCVRRNPRPDTRISWQQSSTVWNNSVNSGR